MNDLKIYLQREQNLALAKKLTFLVWIITVGCVAFSRINAAGKTWFA